MCPPLDPRVGRNTGALLPQLALNARQQSPGGYSPLTAGLACGGCSIRLFTTIELAGSDPLLLAGFGFGLALNGALLAQIIYYGAVVPGRPLLDVFTSDFASGGDAQVERVKRSGSDDELMPIRSDDREPPV